MGDLLVDIALARAVREAAESRTYEPGRASTDGLQYGIPLAQGYPSATLAVTPTEQPAAVTPQATVATTADTAATTATTTTPTGAKQGNTPPAAATPRVPANVGPNVVRQAQALVDAYAGAPLDERKTAFRDAMVQRNSAMFRAALVRAMDAEVRGAIGADPAGLPWDRISQDAQDIAEAEAAASTIDLHLWEHEGVWREAYLAALIQRHGADGLVQQLQQMGVHGGAELPYMAQALSDAQRDGLITGEDARKVSNVNAGLDQASANHLAEPLGDARARYDEAKAKFDALDQEMWQGLRDIGAALMTPDEQDPEAVERVKRFVEEFTSREEYVTARREAEEAAAALGLELESIADDLLARGAGDTEGSATSRTALLDSYDALAGGSEALEAVIWAEAHVADTTFSETERERIRAISEKGQATDASAKMANVVQMLEAAQTAETPEAKADALRQALAFLKDNICTPYGRIKTIVGVTQLGQHIDEIGRNAQILLALYEGGQGAAVDVAARLLAAAPAEASTIVTVVWRGLGSVVSTIKNVDGLVNPSNALAMIGAAEGLYGNLQKLQQVAGAAKAGERTAEEQATALVNRVASGYGDLAKFGFGAIAVASDLIDLQQQLENINRYPDNVAMQIQCAAKIASIIGSTLSLFPPLAPIGALISAVASAIGLIAGLFVGDPEGDRRRAVQEDILSEVLQDPALAEVFSQPASASNLQAAQAGGLSSETIRALGRDRPWLFRDEEDYILRIEALRQLLAAHSDYGHFDGATPTLQEMISTLDKGTLDGLAFYGIFAANGNFDGRKWPLAPGASPGLDPAEAPRAVPVEETNTYLNAIEGLLPYTRE